MRRGHSFYWQLEMNDDASNARVLVDPSGRPLREPKKPRARIPWTKIATWLTFFYVFIIRGDELVSVAERWVLGPGDLTVVEFDHLPRIAQAQFTVPLSGPRRSVDVDTDFVDLQFKLVNHSQQTVLVQRVEIIFEARGSVPEGAVKTATLDLSGEYILEVPNLQPNEQAIRYINVPHVLKPSDADAFKVVLAWPPHVDITGKYSITPRLITSAGVTELESFEVPLLSDRVRAAQP